MIFVVTFLEKAKLIIMMGIETKESNRAFKTPNNKVLKLSQEY